jgi:hypothetical protein
MNFDGTGLTNLTSHPAGDRAAVWSPRPHRQRGVAPSFRTRGSTGRVCRTRWRLGPPPSSHPGADVIESSAPENKQTQEAEPGEQRRVRSSCQGRSSRGGTGQGEPAHKEQPQHRPCPWRGNPDVRAGQPEDQRHRRTNQGTESYNLEAAPQGKVSGKARLERNQSHEHATSEAQAEACPGTQENQPRHAHGPVNLTALR